MGRHGVLPGPGRQDRQQVPQADGREGGRGGSANQRAAATEATGAVRPT